jgi:hypothetical protein
MLQPAVQPTPIERRLQQLMLLVREGRTLVRTLSKGGQMKAAEALATQLTAMERIDLVVLDDLPMSEAIARLDVCIAEMRATITRFIRRGADEATTGGESEATTGGWVSVAVAAAAINVSYSQVQQWMATGKLARRPGPGRRNAVLVNLAEVEAFNAQRRRRQIQIVPLGVAQTISADALTEMVAYAAPVTISTATTAPRDKVQRSGAIFVEADWWHDPKPLRNPTPGDTPMNDWQEAASCN